MDFLDRLLDYIESNVVLDGFIKIGRLGKEGNSISIRSTPSSVDSRFMDKDKTREYSFQILVKNQSEVKARELTHNMSSLLDGLSNRAIQSDNGSFIFVKCETYVLPNLVEVTEHNEYIYTAMFTAELQGGI